MTRNAYASTATVAFSQTLFCCQRVSFCRLAVLVLFCAAVSSAQVVSDRALQQIHELLLEKSTRTAAQHKLDSQLHYAARTATGTRISPTIGAMPAAQSSLDMDKQGKALVDIKAVVSLQLLNAVTQLGGTVVSSVPSLGSIRARLPIARIEDLAALSEVKFIRPADHGTGHREVSVASLNRSRVSAQLQAALTGGNSNGDVAHGANIARTQFHVDGSGVKVGVLSDGVDSLTTLQMAGKLPPNVTIVPGQAGAGDEGTAMLEIVHDLVPGAQLFFATAAFGSAQMAVNIEALRSLGCDIILDDWTYFAESVFQDGDIAQAVNKVTSDGALYFSDAQNSGNLDEANSGTWEGDFVASNTTLPGIIGTIHNFNGTDHDLITAGSGFGFFSLKWSDPVGASDNDYDLFFLDSSLQNVVAASTNVQNGTQDPIEAIGCGSGCGAGWNIVIVKNAGASQRALHIDTERGRLAIGTDGATFGHNAAGSAITVAAVDVFTAGGGLFTGGTANPVESYSSDGPRRMFYHPDGTPLTAGNVLFSTFGGTLLPKVDVAAADCVTTDVPGFFIFCGTSAATPHAGAIAALIKSAEPRLAAEQIVAVMKNTALDIMGPGWDRDSGSGIVMANRALATIVSGEPSLTLAVKGRETNGELIRLNLALTNTGTAAVFNPKVTGFEVKSTDGSGMVRIIEFTPAQADSLAPAQTLATELSLSVPRSVDKLLVRAEVVGTTSAGQRVVLYARTIVSR